MAQTKLNTNVSAGKIQVTLVKSLIGTKESHRACARGLGLRRLNHTVFVEDTLAVRGMINKIYYLVKFEVSNATQ